MHGSSTAQTRSIRVTRRISARLSSRRSRVFDPLDFLAEVSAHIPDAHEKTTLFYGWYSNRTRGYRKQHGLLAKGEAPDPLPGPVARAPLEVRRSCLRRAQARRARLIRQVYEVDPLVCPQCGGAMKVIALIDRPAVIQRILEHLGLSTAAPSLRTPPDPPDGLAADQLRAWSYELLFDLPVRRTQTGDLPIPDPVLV